MRITTYDMYIHTLTQGLGGTGERTNTFLNSIDLATFWFLCMISPRTICKSDMLNPRALLLGHQPPYLCPYVFRVNTGLK